MRYLMIAVVLLPCLAVPALAQSGSRSATSSGVVSGQGWNTGQDLHNATTATARRRAEALKSTPNRNYSGLPNRPRTTPSQRP